MHGAIIKEHKGQNFKFFLEAAAPEIYKVNIFSTGANIIHASAKKFQQLRGTPRNAIKSELLTKPADLVFKLKLPL